MNSRRIVGGVLILIALAILAPLTALAGTTPGEVEQFKQIKAEAEKGDKGAQYVIGNYYRVGFGVEKSDKEAATWYQRSAEQGVDIAQYYLGNYYAEGVGVPKDLVEAYAYLNLAGVAFGDARRNRDKLESKMSPDQITAGQKRSRELQKEIEAKLAAKKAGK